MKVDTNIYEGRLIEIFLYPETEEETLLLRSFRPLDSADFLDEEKPFIAIENGWEPR